MKKPVSHALGLMQYVWLNASSRSWRRLNVTLHNAMRVAIGAGMHFDPEDMATIYKTMRGWHWFNGEYLYEAAVKYNNRSACISYEKHMKRAPFIYEGKRLFVGASIKWPGMGMCRVTSFADKGIIICAFRTAHEQLVMMTEHRMTDTTNQPCNPGAPKRRKTVSLSELQEAERARKARDRALKYGTTTN